MTLYAIAGVPRAGASQGLFGGGGGGVSILRDKGAKVSTEPLFVNVYGAQESILEESISPGWESIPGLIKRFTNTGSGLTGRGDVFSGGGGGG